MLGSVWSSGLPPEAEAHLAACRAEVSRAGGRSSPELWRPVVERWRDLEASYQLAYALFRNAEAVLEHDGSRGVARDLLWEAHALCSALGSVPLREAVVGLAKASGFESGRQAASHRAPASPVAEEEEAGLTPREVEVLTLVAAGLTNREISERLCISRHTAGVHVSHILSKLGVRNRVMAAAAARRLGFAVGD
jgi:DNA-binding CsgD family transcriptional regulator